MNLLSLRRMSFIKIGQKFFVFKIIILTFLFSLSTTGWSSGGIGVILEHLPEKKIHRIRAVFQGSPAARAKVEAGDEIVSVNGKPTENLSFEELGKQIRGEAGETVTLTLKSPKTGSSREVKLIRAGQQTLSPIVVTPSNSPSPLLPPPKPTFTATESENLKQIIRQLQTDEERKRMEKILLEYKTGKISKLDFIGILKAEFPQARKLFR